MLTGLCLYPSNTFTAWSLHCVWPLISPPSLRVDSTPTATLCIIPPLNQTVFVTNTGARSSCEIGKKKKASSLFCLKKKKISTESQHALRCIQSTTFKVCRISHGLLQLISSMLPWDIAARRKLLISCCFIIMHVHIHPSHLSPAFPLLSTSLLVRSKSTCE